MSVWIVTNNWGEVLEVFESRDGAVSYLISRLKEAAIDDDKKWKNFINFYDLYMLEDEDKDLSVRLSEEYIIYAEKKEVIKVKYTL